MALNESALMEQFKATVALKDSEISKIHAENEKLSTELKKIKNRYKGMRTILDEAELKEKVAILLEVEQLRKVSKFILITVYEYNSYHISLKNANAKPNCTCINRTGTRCLKMLLSLQKNWSKARLENICLVKSSVHYR